MNRKCNISRRFTKGKEEKRKEAGKEGRNEKKKIPVLIKDRLWKGIRETFKITAGNRAFSLFLRNIHK